jgi:hypothetical protein
MEPFALGLVPSLHKKNGHHRNMPAKRTKSKVDQQIDENLKRVYDDVLNADVPDRFIDLIQQLRQSEGSQRPDGTDSDDA